MTHSVPIRCLAKKTVPRFLKWINLMNKPLFLQGILHCMVEWNRDIQHLAKSVRFLLYRYNWAHTFGSFLGRCRYKAGTAPDSLVLRTRVTRLFSYIHLPYLCHHQCNVWNLRHRSNHSDFEDIFRRGKKHCFEY